MKKLISVTLAVLIVAVTIPTVSAVSYNGFTLEKNSSGTYDIVDYTGSNNSVSINDATYNGIKITAIRKGAFQNKTRITDVRINGNITAVGANAFYGCKNLNSVVLNEKITSIGSKAFSGCTSLTGINLKNVKTIGEHAFYGCTQLSNITMGSALKVIGDYAFQRCTSISTLRFASTLTYIGNYSFANCTSIQKLNFPDLLANIGNSAFKNCTSLTSVSFGTGKLKIGAYAFESCNGLTSVTIPTTVTSIGRNAFAARPSNSTFFSHGTTLYCNKNSAAADYAKLYNAPAYINEYNKIIHFGDYDNDGQLDKNDAKALLKNAAGHSKKITGETLYRCDMNSNNKTDTGDVSTILKYANA